MPAMPDSRPANLSLSFFNLDYAAQVTRPRSRQAIRIAPIHDSPLRVLATSLPRRCSVLLLFLFI